MAKLNQKDLLVSDVSDYIRQRYKSGAKSIVWGKQGLKIFNGYLELFVGNLSINEIHGIKFCGMRHYIRNYKN